jgi:hypothetical protein
MCASPYYSNIFAQNGIKLAISKYENPGADIVLDTTDASANIPNAANPFNRNKVSPATMNRDEYEGYLEIGKKTIHKYKLPVKKGNWILCKKLTSDSNGGGFDKIISPAGACSSSVEEKDDEICPITNKQKLPEDLKNDGVLTEAVELINDLIKKMEIDETQNTNRGSCFSFGEKCTHSLLNHEIRDDDFFSMQSSVLALENTETKSKQIPKAYIKIYI